MAKRARAQVAQGDDATVEVEKQDVGPPRKYSDDYANREGTVAYLVQTEGAIVGGKKCSVGDEVMMTPDEVKAHQERAVGFVSVEEVEKKKEVEEARRKKSQA